MKGRCLEPQQAVSFASQYLFSFLSQNSDDVVCGGLVSASRWIPPPLDHVKVNFDGATFRQGQELRVGVIGRGSSGDCLAWLSKRLLKPGDGELAEVLAAREAVLLALHKSWPSVIFEGDCANVIQKILSPVCDFSSIGPIILDIRSLCAGFQAWSFQYVKRACNDTAHALASLEVCSLEDDTVLPPAVMSCVIADLPQ
ncbi:UNVERIFIED_CONTAM: hypothetical protein Sradi_2084000 [Sesamum radiatum]|uniref:RNase H type-1 domain-containing protein n=1 Tax=Sesamum radiatum TaxID=300843 RepID=A0AAW2TIA4_SESRA